MDSVNLYCIIWHIRLVPKHSIAIGNFNHWDNKNKNYSLFTVLKCSIHNWRCWISINSLANASVTSTSSHWFIHHHRVRIVHHSSSYSVMKSGVKHFLKFCIVMYDKIKNYQIQSSHMVYQCSGCDQGKYWLQE